MLRVIGGDLRGRRFSTPPGRKTRPTSDRVRENIFNTLATMFHLPGAHVLDLFAGSGAMGIEAFSRGAATITFVEAHPRTAGMIRGNLDRLGIPRDRARVVVARVERWLTRHDLSGPTGLVLMDPPYEYDAYEEVLAGLMAIPMLADDALIVAETAQSRTLRPPPGLEPLRTKRYGDSLVWFLTKGIPPPCLPAVENIP